MEQPTRKRRRHNEACNTTRGATIIGAMRGTCWRDQQETAASKEKQVTSLNAEKKSNSIVLTLVSKRKEQCEEACMTRSQGQRQEARPPLPSSGDGAVEGVADPQEMIVDEYWEVNENSEGCDGYFSTSFRTRKQGALEEQTNQVVRHQREGFAGDEGTLRQQS
jgi:hypothetical protein